MAADPDPVTRAEAAALVAAGDVAELTDRFDRRLVFGTAGLRGAVGAGPNRMNRLVVRQAATGLMRWLPDGATVVIGYDARPSSAEFARETAAVVIGLGGTPILGHGPLPTPALAHAVLDRRADAGVMVTASHNPRGDNGYKVYLADGRQLVSPADTEIEALIVEAAAADDGTESDRPVHPGADDVGPATVDAPVDLVGPYLDAVAAELGPAEAGCPLTVVYTAMHGVGSDALHALFDRLGLPAPVVVPEQDRPDGAFPTTAFPNPEEPGALDLAFARARDVRADLVIANDPDADRLGVAVPDAAADGGWARLSGDELGLLLGDAVLARTSGDDRLVASSIVSSRSLAALAARRGVAHEATLTGFKWVARAGEGTEARLVYGYEEALGYAVTPLLVRDKDGIGAAAELVRLACRLRQHGSSLRARLDELMADIGVFVTALATQRVEGAGATERLAAAMDELRRDPPAAIGSVAVTEVEDLSPGGRLPPADVLIFKLADGSRAILRPSGTEPKLKAYLEVTGDAVGDVEGTRARLGSHVAALADALAEVVSSRLG